jgi:hypothetical protein
LPLKCLRGLRASDIPAGGEEGWREGETLYDRKISNPYHSIDVRGTLVILRAASLPTPPGSVLLLTTYVAKGCSLLQVPATTS